MRVIISGGGTGGHIFPAIAIANALKLKDPSAEILFVGANGRMEMEKVPAAGYRIVGLNIAGFQRRLTYKNLMFPFKLMKSLIDAKKIIRDFKPDIVIGVGGYASGPTLQMAVKLKVPCLIQEQNSYPGVTNKILAKKVNKICVAYDNMDKFFPAEKIVFTGNPIRQDIANIEAKRDEGIEYFKIDKTKKTLFVMGGSLGAGTINKSMQKIAASLENKGIQVIWQTGKVGHAEFKNSVAAFKDIKVMEFITRMDLAYSVADFIVSRAGAISISELCVVGKPTILIPSPNVSEDHQTKNAMALVDKHAAVLVKNIEAVEKLYDAIISIVDNTNLQYELSRNIAKLAETNAAEKIALEALKLIETKK